MLTRLKTTRLAPLAACAASAIFCACRPAAVQAQTPDGISVQAFFDDAKGPLKSGDVMHVTLQGTRNGRATFAIPGVVERITLKETTPGVYVGDYTVPRNISVSGAAVVGRLSYPGIASPLVPADGPVTLDSLAPRVTLFSPGKGATTESARPLIVAAFSDQGGVGVDPAGVRLRLDGADQTPNATVTPFSVAVTPAQPLAVGQHTAEVVVADRLGNTQTTSWNFTVEPPQLVSSFTADAPPDQPVAVGQTVRFTLNAQTGGQARVSVSGVAANVPLGEGKPGVYTGEYTVRSNDGAQDVPVSAQFKAASGRTVTLLLPTGLTIKAGSPLPPRILNPPIDDVEAGDTIDIEGAALPGATVRVTTRYVSQATGGLLTINGTAGTVEVTADGKGVWRADQLPLHTESLFARDQDTVFKISAVTVAPGGGLSDPVTISVRRGE